MASALNKQRNYKAIAETYSKTNEPQIECGKKFLKELCVKRGDKVVDMGCGTGEITSFIAEQVGDEGEVLGIDPDQERIKVAVQKHCEGKRNVKFMVGDSSSHFPHYNEGYFDIHYSNFVFQWLTAQERVLFLRSAYNCLKSGGRIAILNMDEYPEILTSVPKLLPDEEKGSEPAVGQCIKKAAANSVLEASGFVIRLSEYIVCHEEFPDLETFLTWFCASAYIDESKIVPHKKEAFAKRFVNELDGTVCFDAIMYKIIATK